MNNELTALQHLNLGSEVAVWDDFSRCCGASKWVLNVMRARPFADVAALFEASERAFDSLTEADWLEAFAHHPKIGDIESLRSKFAATREWAGNEQSGTNAADEVVLGQLSRENHNYEERFGFIFIICATGKSAEEMLAALQARLPNTVETEISNAAREQKQITHLRLRKLLNA